MILFTPNFFCFFRSNKCKGKLVYRKIIRVATTAKICFTYCIYYNSKYYRNVFNKRKGVFYSLTDC